MEVAFKKCTSDCDDHRCTQAALHGLDTAVAFYTGSLAATGHGKFHYSLANELCRDFRTCGAKGDSSKHTTARINREVFVEFQNMQESILADNCPDVRRGKDHVSRKMNVPLIQATLRSAYKRDGMGEHVSEEERAIGATFAASVLPMVARCSRDDAQIIFQNMELSAQRTSFAAVKSAFERQYGCLAITCDDVGGYYHIKRGRYYDGADPCVSPRREDDEDSGSHLPIGLAAVALLGLAVFWYLRKKLQARNERLAKYDEDNDLSDSSGDDDFRFT